MWNVASGRGGLPESCGEEDDKTEMEKNAGMMEVQEAASETLPENFDKDTFIPWHPGAVKWFEENGFDIPDELEG